MAIIKESFLLIATNADVLAAPSRLAAIPSNGVLTIEASALQSNAVNRGTLTLQLPDGDVPFEDLVIPANGQTVTEHVLNLDTMLKIVMPVAQGGHVLLNFTEVGAVEIILHVTLAF